MSLHNHVYSINNKTSKCNSTSISPSTVICPVLRWWQPQVKKCIKIQGLWWVVMQYHIYSNANILSFHIKNGRALLVIIHKVKHRFLYFWFYYQYADISSEVSFMKQIALKTTLYRGWSCWRKMYNSIDNTNTNVLQIQCCITR
jgi:hypothetical protein